ncbi:period circadian protein homolog 2 isoform X2 [Scyliorhinus torazame]|uniref:period circadian protein homolog 2 isoform X2 n=1 Tax=Scyliorhinus torazame TaxID=75743 RepID=UPI003B5A4569
MATYLKSGFQEAELVLHSRGANIQDQAQDQGVQQLPDDVEMKSSSGTDSNGNEFSESSSSSASQNGKDSALLLDSLESSKSSNSQSLSLHSSSNGFSLISASSEQDNPSTSGCSSDQSAKAKKQKELIKALSVLKRHLPSDKTTKGKSRTLSTLKYALRCIKQVGANEEYYKFLMNDDSEPSNLSMNSFTVDEVENITSEYTLKNADIFAVTVSLITGHIVYISDQASSILNCNKDVFKNVKFTELLAPQDVGVFYSFTKPSQLPPWSVRTAADSSPPDCMEEKSFFCRISGDRQRDHSIHYYPFRMTTYLTKVRASEDDDDQLCCLLLAERVHSGYEAPRIPHDKRIFTTTHTPSCVFQDVDERAVPLMGYLPQDLIGTSVLMHLHPDDRALMLGIHKKILKHAGQPFEHSPLRFCSQNGEYITIDTSWSSFVNPWSRKVSFIIGRHKVRTGPLNEDVFASPGSTEVKTLHPEIQTITEQIRQLLLQPVYNNGSSGYGSLGSNGSYAQFMSVASSSDSNGNINEESRWDKPMTFQKICKDVHLVKNQGQTVFIDSRGKNESKRRHKTVTQQKETNNQIKDVKASSSKGAAPGSAVKNMLLDDSRCKKQPVYCYQQVNCLDSVIRYLDSYNIPSTLKRKCESSSASDDDKEKTHSMQVSKEASPLPPQSVRVPFKAAKEVPIGAVVGTSLAPLSLPRKAASVTSQCSYSSTIVHVGDKKLQADAEILLEDGLGIADPAENMASTALVTTVPSMNQEKEPYRKLGLTKEVLAAHTQKEEQIFLSKFKELRKLNTFEPSGKSYLQDQCKGCSGDCGSQGFKAGWNHAEPVYKKGGKNKKLKSKRIKQQELSDSTASRTNHRKLPSWHPSAVSQSRYSAIPFTTVMPPYQLSVFSAHGGMPPVTDPSLHNFENTQGVHCTTQPPPYSAPLVTPMVAFVLPHYMLPQMTDAVHQPFFAGQPSFPSQSAFLPQTPFSAQTSFQSQPQFASQHYGPTAEGEKAPAPESRGAPSCCCTPQSGGPHGPTSPPLFQSRCSSPLQLNLLQLEEMPKSSEGIAFVGIVGGSGSMADGGGMSNSANVANVDIVAKDEAELTVSPAEAQNSDAHSTSTDLLDLLLQDSLSGSAGSGSARSTASGSSGSPSNGCGMSGTDTGSSHLSNTSKYFGSIDSSENDHKSKLRKAKKIDHFTNCVLKDPVWLSMANTDERTMMTYQLPSRDIETILKEDREKLKMMQRNQPKFTEDQKKELSEVFPWFKTNMLPKTIDITELVCWEKNESQSNSTTFDAEIHNLELNGLIDQSHNVGYQPLNFATEEQKHAEIATNSLETATSTFGNSAS